MEVQTNNYADLNHRKILYVREQLEIKKEYLLLLYLELDDIRLENFAEDYQSREFRRIFGQYLGKDAPFKVEDVPDSMIQNLEGKERMARLSSSSCLA